MSGAIGEFPVRHDGVAGLSWLTRAELAFLLGFIPQSGRFLEIGTASGATMAVVARERPEVQVLCVDHFPDHDAPHVTAREPCRVDLWRRNRAPNMALWLGDSASLLSLHPAARFAAALVDGGHRQEHAWADLNAAAFLLADDGTLLVHDYDDPAAPGVSAAVDRLCREGRYSVVAVGGSLAALQRG